MPGLKKKILKLIVLGKQKITVNKIQTSRTKIIKIKEGESQTERQTHRERKINKIKKVFEKINIVDKFLARLIR